MVSSTENEVKKTTGILDFLVMYLPVFNLPATSLSDKSIKTKSGFSFSV